MDLDIENEELESKVLRRILIVEDQEEFADMLADCLASMKVQVKKVPSLAALEECLQTEPPHIVLLDHVLSDGFGSAWAADHREALKELGVSLIGISSHKDISSEFLKSGARDFIQKPFNPAEVEWRISNEIRFLDCEEQNQMCMDRLAELNVFKDELLATTAHDIRSPIGNMIAIADLLEKQVLDHEKEELQEIFNESGSVVHVRCLARGL